MNNEIIEMLFCIFVKYAAVGLATVTVITFQNKSLLTS